jgi:hypothetical protein|tara:strand:+ start:5788 stop:5901 length:114 start_codon:yes stop_codon:yes gene_type:complete
MALWFQVVGCGTQSLALKGAAVLQNPTWQPWPKVLVG